MLDNKSIASFAEMRRIVAEFPGPDRDAATTTRAREGQLTKPAGALGRLEELALWLSTWQGKAPPAINHPRVAVFAGNHGVAALGVSAFPAEVTRQMVLNFTHGGAAVNQLCKNADADLRVYEMSLDQPTRDFTQEPALGEVDAARAMAYGMMAVEPGIDLLCLGEMGIANTTAAAALAAALFGGTGTDWAGPGTGVQGAQLSRKAEVIDLGLARHRASFDDPFAIMACLGGHELAAITGAVIAARVARVPVLLDGFASTVAAAVLLKLDPHALDHCVVSHCSAEPGHRKLLEKIAKKPLLDFGMRLGEGSGAALCIPILRAAALCHSGMATFAEAGVSDKG
ncbi:nicotinate-nucleotide--dimethylbenzimidazole phosphoribosyltransferase [Dongia mobilis]|jgi:nicotinate-nucleotide--dimethylbenzimidazole phosphoribosyltransferase|uniref:nicotinate-nucleotide--dimethylbenzimidazole phosphoribosyltransferase n=1 Tax=Dongia sp. TaxID=1977262 RepID=UPI0026F1DC76